MDCSLALLILPFLHACCTSSASLPADYGELCITTQAELLKSHVLHDQGIVFHKRLTSEHGEDNPFSESMEVIKAEAIAHGCIPNKRMHALYCEAYLRFGRELVRSIWEGAGRVCVGGRWGHFETATGFICMSVCEWGCIY